MFDIVGLASLVSSNWFFRVHPDLPPTETRIHVPDGSVPCDGSTALLLKSPVTLVFDVLLDDIEEASFFWLNWSEGGGDSGAIAMGPSCGRV